MTSFLTHSLSTIGIELHDTDQVRTEKTLLLSVALMFIPAGALWGIMYGLLGEPLAAAIPGGYAVISALSILIFARVRRLSFLRWSQLVLILLLPFALQAVLGGFINSSGVVLWALLCPIGALVFAGTRQALGWLTAYVALLALSGWLQVTLQPAHTLPLPLIALFFVLNFGAISAITFTLLYIFIRQKNNALRLLNLEQIKSEGLLLNILPKEIAARLKERQGVIANRYAPVTILFADLVGFTPLSADLAPEETVGILNDIFTHFDDLMDTYEVEKIETVGDEYMAASGVPRARTDHAQAIARTALEMQQWMQGQTTASGHTLQIRIGIHSGAIVAGVIGRKKFAYELFGDTVNVANRMQSQGVPGHIQISQATYELLKDEFLCEPRGTIPIKGKGDMPTWFLIGVGRTA